MRVIFGYFLILLLALGFSLSLAGTMNQYHKKAAISEVLDEAINVKDLESEIDKTSYIIDKNGQVLSEVYTAVDRIPLSFSEIPEDVIHAFIATEDQNFYSHQGFDLFGITRALLVNAKKDSIEQGGSTITQQLIRNIYLNNEQTYNRKLSEVLFSYQIEQELTKDKIIELYINTIYFHNQAYGIEAASRYYFSKTTSELSLAEIAFLCAIPNNPSFYNPLQHFENTKTRQQWILTKLLENNFITAKEYEDATNQEIKLSIKERIDLYPNYVTYIYEEFKQLISLKEGYQQQLNESESVEEKERIENNLTNRVDQILKSGIIIETAIERKLQEYAELSIKKNLRSSDIEGSIVIIDNSTNEIVALVGGKDYRKLDFHRAFQSYRQPGSAIKPLLVYGPYLAEFGLSTTSPINAGAFCRNGYCPQNYGNSQYGRVSIETAFKYSYNTAAVRILDTVGIQRSFEYLEKFQFKKLVQEDHNLPAAVGGFTNGMTPLELTNAYTTFANNGNFIPARAIRTVVDSEGNLLYSWDDMPINVWDKNTNDKMLNLLSKVMTEGTGRRGYFSSAYIGGKTGTTNDFKDLWFVGLTEDYTAGVWIGKDHPTSISDVNDRSPQLQIWREIMQGR